MRHIAILGSTGSIGRSTLSVVDSYPDRFEVVSLAAGKNLDAAFDQACRWKPKLVSVAEAKDAEALGLEFSISDGQTRYAISYLSLDGKPTGHFRAPSEDFIRALGMDEIQCTIQLQQ